MVPLVPGAFTRRATSAAALLVTTAAPAIHSCLVLLAIAAGKLHDSLAQRSSTLERKHVISRAPIFLAFPSDCRSRRESCHVPLGRLSFENSATCGLSDEPIVLRMAADPRPDHAILKFNGESTIVRTYAY